MRSTKKTYKTCRPIRRVYDNKKLIDLESLVMQPETKEDKPCTFISDRLHEVKGK